MTPDKPVRPPFANAWFFPAALLYGLAVIPLWVLGLLGWVSPLPGLQQPAGHAHEMLFGYAMAVVAGYLLGPQPLRFTLILLLAWITARMSFLVWPGGWIALLSSALFAAGFAVKAVPRFARSAKKWRNRIVAPLAATLALLTAGAATVLGPHRLPAEIQSTLLLVMLTLLALLMLYMGGRILAPAIAGHLQAKGLPMPARVQPALEGLGMICLIAAAILTALPWFGLQSIAAVLLVVAGITLLVRLTRWQLWHCGDRPDLWSVALGYGWLGIGVILLGLSELPTRIPATLGIHTLTIGALGGLTVTVMARTRLLFRFRNARHSALPVLAALSLSVAVLSRAAGVLLPGLPHATQTSLLVSAVAWSLALAATLIAVIYTLPPFLKPQAQKPQVRKQQAAPV